MLKWIVTAAVVVVVAFPLALLLLVAAAASPGAGGTVAVGGPSLTALAGIPPSYLVLYLDAARTCQGLPWSVLAHRRG